ncbi:hypothetical protein EYF80_004631 [Liparis tanakae]|uniref:Uncharacterized protein n=1 Tax=Liparis tanakae TaxID=230148 RepID=A0A4Z2J4N2_9TELE|nr:hypothetical protein EYF80_004631 [Liparis tanakae]
MKDMVEGQKVFGGQIHFLFDNIQKLQTLQRGVLMSDICTTEEERLPSSPPLPAINYGLASTVAGHFDIVPRVVVELSIDWLYDGLKGSRAQIYNEGDSAVLQCQVDVVS